MDPLRKNSLRSLLPPTHTMANLIPFQLSLTHPRTHRVSFTAQESGRVVSTVESFILSTATELPTPHPPARDSAYMRPKHYLTRRLDWLVTQMDDPLPSHELVAPYLLSEESESQVLGAITRTNIVSCTRPLSTRTDCSPPLELVPSIPRSSCPCPRYGCAQAVHGRWGLGAYLGASCEGGEHAFSAWMERYMWDLR
ncbi:hypothetical protein EDC04DRAFT_2780778 [Pisolithus marmoratus]|nr:hypothetical protein EDC04DRAFT_2780778 [Pisolithus marmoratus]